MKIKFIGKTYVNITMTTKQFSAIRAALDSVTLEASRVYADVYLAERALYKAMRIAIERKKRNE